MKPVQIKGGRQIRGFTKPMTATLSNEPAFNHDDWLFEIKWDGYRAIAEVGKKELLFYSRNGITYDKAYPTITKELEKIGIDAVIDGEVVVFDESGKPSFQRLQNYSSNKSLPIQYLVFDCLRCDGRDLTALPLIKRKEILKEILPSKSIVMYCDHVTAKGKELYKAVVAAGMEGVIAKHAQSKYYVDRRSKEWLKIKNILSDDFVIVGFTAPQGSRSHLGSLVIAEHVNGKLMPRGNVGTGFTEKTLKEVHSKLRRLTRSKSPLDAPGNVEGDVTWVEPEYTCRVKYTEITGDGNVRHPVFLGFV